jgi:serine/threonine-protein kinase
MLSVLPDLDAVTVLYPKSLSLLPDVCDLMCLSVRDRFCQLKPQRTIARWTIVLILGKAMFSPTMAIGASPPRSPASASAIIAPYTNILASTAVTPPTRGQFGSPTHCGSQPSGLGFPGFPLGSSRSAVEAMLGIPVDEFRGYWGDTIALVYHLIPNQVSLGLLFDRRSQQLQQTEASFALSIGIDVVFETLDSMLGCRLDDTIREGIRQVWSKDIRRYRFANETLLGVVEWESADRLYIGIWLVGLHDY